MCAPRQHVSSRLHPGAEQDEIRSQGLIRMYNFHYDFRLVLVVFLPTEGLTGFASVFVWKSKKNSKQNSAPHVCRAGEVTNFWILDISSWQSRQFFKRNANLRSKNVKI